MLTRFAVTNYRGFAKRIEWNLSQPSCYTFNQHAIEQGTVKDAIIYGPNGSGKSNLGLAIFDIANHLSHKWKKPDYYLNYASAYGTEKPVTFEYTFLLGGQVVEYGYSKVTRDLKGELVSELLRVDGQEVLYRDGDQLRIAAEFMLSDAALAGLRCSANNISLVNYLLGAAPLHEGHALLRLRDFVEKMLFFRSLDNREFIGLREGGSNIEEYIISNHLTSDFARFLRDISGQDFTFAQSAENEKMLYCIIGGVKIPFVLVASTGTQNLELQYFWLQEMSKASFVFIDEFDAFYHHKLSYAICQRLFQNRQQVFLTTHDTFLLSNDLLRPDCFFILKDNVIRCLSELTDKELRLGHNLEKLYRGGAFGL